VSQFPSKKVTQVTQTGPFNKCRQSFDNFSLGISQTFHEGFVAKEDTIIKIPRGNEINLIKKP